MTCLSDDFFEFFAIEDVDAAGLWAVLEPDFNLPVAVTESLFSGSADVGCFLYQRNEYLNSLDLILQPQERLIKKNVIYHDYEKKFFIQQIAIR